MFNLLFVWFRALVRALRSRRHLLLENLALRQQLSVLKRRRPRPILGLFDKLFWVAVRRFWSGWQQSLIAVTPETVVRWHKAGFRLYWKLISKVRRPIGRRQTSNEVRELIFRMVVENPTWGAPRIHGELLMLGFDVSERTISRWMKRAPRDPELAKRWLTFLRNHRGAIAAMDFFTVPTVTFSVLYCFFVISHDRRRILHFNIRGVNPVRTIAVDERLSSAKIPSACEINSIRIVFHRSCEVPNASCSASFLSFLVAFAVLFNPDRGCYSKIWSCGSNSPSSSGSILGRDSTRPTNSFGLQFADPGLAGSRASSL